MQQYRLYLVKQMDRLLNLLDKIHQVRPTDVLIGYSGIINTLRTFPMQCSRIALLAWQFSIRQIFPGTRIFLIIHCWNL